MKENEKLARLLKNTYLANNTSKGFKRLKGFQKAYSTSNEDLVALFEAVNVKGKRVLTVGSSGDQTLYAILNGAKEVHLVDLCPYAKVFLDYKISAIKTFTYEQFVENFRFMYIKNLVNGKNRYVTDTDFVTSDVYKKISHNMDAESRDFWDNYFLEMDKAVDFTIDAVDSVVGAEFTYLKDKNTYDKLKEKLKRGEFVVKFTNDDIIHFSQNLKNNERYDVILLSNLIDYISKNFILFDSGQVIKKFKNQIFNNLSLHLTTGGVMQVDYLFEDFFPIDKTNFPVHNEYVGTFKKYLGRKNIKLVPSGGSVLYVKSDEEEWIPN